MTTFNTRKHPIYTGFGHFLLSNVDRSISHALSTIKFIFSDMDESNIYYICLGTDQPQIIQRAILTAIKSEIPPQGNDEALTNILQNELQSLQWDKLLIIISKQALENPHWKSLELKYESIIPDLSDIEDQKLGSIAIFEHRKDVAALAQEKKNEVDIIFSLINDSGNSSLTVEKHLENKSRIFSFSKLKKFFGKFKSPEKEQREINPQDHSTPGPNERHLSDIIDRPYDTDEEDSSRYDNFYTPSKKVNFNNTVSKRSISPIFDSRTNRTNLTENQSFLGHSSSCDTTRCRDYRKKVSMRLNAQIDIPNFDPLEDLVDLVIEKLKLINTDLAVDQEQLIYSFCYKNGLGDTHVTLSNYQRSDLKEFSKILRQRFGTNEASAASRFNAIKMKSDEDENDLMNRIVQLANLMKRKPINTPLDRSEAFFIREKFISSLNDPTIRLLLRQMNTDPDELVGRARELRLAKQTEQRAEKHLPTQIVALTRRIDELEMKRLECSHCGRSHHSNECRENPKGKAEYRKTQQGQRRPRNYVHFDERGRNINYQNFRPQNNIHHSRSQNNFRNFRPEDNFYNHRPQNNPRQGYPNRPRFYSDDNQRYHRGYSSRRDNYFHHDRNSNREPNRREYNQHGSFLTNNYTRENSRENSHENEYYS